MLSRIVEARVIPVLAAALIAPVAAGAQAEFNLGPFLTYNTMHGGRPAASGLETGVFVGPVGLRASGFTALDQPAPGSTTPRWGGDADLLFIFDLSSRGGGRPGLAPYVFAGAGLAVQNDTMGYYSSQISNGSSLFGGWSYGAGLLLPIGSYLEALGEVRQRPSGFFNSSPSSRSTRNEFRVGLSIRLGSSLGTRDEAPAPPRPRGRRAEGGVSIGDIGHVIFPMSSRAVGESPIILASGGSSTASRVVPTAEHYIGVPYRYGGTSPRTGFDCSGFVQYVFAEHAVRLPRTSRQQARVGIPLRADVRALAPGDLVMFAEDGGRISHVAIYAGDDRIIHSSSSGGGVRLEDLTTRRGEWFVRHMVAARRVVPDGRGLMLDLARALDAQALADSMLDLPDHAPRP